MAGKKVETGRLNITVKDGVDVDRQRYGDTKGSYFEGAGQFDERTVIVHGEKRSEWSLLLEDVKNGGRQNFKFGYEMYIGRTPPQGGEVKLVISGDGSVSGRHCMIYEQSGRLVIMDLGSKNHTYLNGTQITQPTGLAMWSQIQVGKSAFRVINMGKS